MHVLSPKPSPTPNAPPPSKTSLALCTKTSPSQIIDANLRSRRLAALSNSPRDLPIGGKTPVSTMETTENSRISRRNPAAVSHHSSTSMVIDLWWPSPQHAARIRFPICVSPRRLTCFNRRHVGAVAHSPEQEPRIFVWFLLGLTRFLRSGEW